MVLLLSSVSDANRQANRYLSLLLAICSVSLIGGFMEVTNYYLVYPQLIGWEFQNLFLYGPLFYLYVCSLTSLSAVPFTRKTALHFLPCMIFVVYLIPIYLADGETKAVMWRQVTQGHPSPGQDVVFCLATVQLTAYGVVSYVTLGRYNRRIRDQFSSIERINLAWLRRLLIAFASVVGLFTVFWFMPLSAAHWYQLNYSANLLLAGAIYVFGFWGTRQPRIFQRALVPAATVAVTTVSKYERGLDTESSAVVYREIVAAMEGARLYTNNELSLSDLAQQLGISTHVLSQAINQHSGANFYDFVNRYRVNETKRGLADPAQANRTVLDIAHDAGFNSKSAFYAAFKRELGLTPLQYRQQELVLPAS